MRVYKFMPRQYGLETIANRRLKVSELPKANDVYEYAAFQIHAPGVQEDFDKIFEETKKSMFADMGILSFSEHTENPVVWGHYAECNQGICLGFDVDENNKSPGSKQSPLRKVTYSSEPELFTINKSDPIDIEDLKRQVVTFFVLSLDKGLFTKYDVWSYEKEWRTILPFQITIGEHHFVEFGQRFVLKEVVLGCRNPDTKADVERLLSQTGHSGVEVWKVKPMATNFRMIRDTSFDNSENTFQKALVNRYLELQKDSSKPDNGANATE